LKLRISSGRRGRLPRLRRLFPDEDSGTPQWLELARAEKWLHLARANPNNSAGYIARMEAHLLKAQAAYADIGTTEQEVAALRH
jgi:hypothetical protein